ncbi:MAG: CBS and ACT domain-containing protein [Humidesulfovibrio sp.]|uniref:CBS and ACT domain-containing protein n=1 Tax=Humidesulfovibrio sp. TaxID=2910988 RepID=UPI0027349A8E|nr:CBS and ACT domain-containing protein [Humidesulfovibrio sp.]MDP2847124.1 CBS and ACT domain-containing protein [Humidesulfovibrio sp.]
MLIENWMTKEVITGTPEMSMMKASKIMKEKGVGRLPIVDEAGVLMGLVSDRDIKEASPSKATTLDMHELYYLLSEVKLKDIMTKKVVTIKKGETVERAAQLMLESNIGGMPVVDDQNKVVGMVTDSDIFKVLVRITGVMEGGVQIGVRLPNEPGGLVPVLDFLKDNGARLMSLLTSCEPADVGMRDVFLRIRDMDKTAMNALKAEMHKKFEVVYWV